MTIFDTFESVVTQILENLKVVTQIYVNFIEFDRFRHILKLVTRLYIEYIVRFDSCNLNLCQINRIS